MPTRRRLLAALPSVALAGCLGRTTGPGGADARPTETTTDAPTTTEFPADLVRRDGRTAVDFPGMSDGEVSVDSARNVTDIAFSGSVEADFELVAAVDGETAGEASPIAASRTLTPADEPRAFVAPVYREDAGFEFRVYVNTAFRELGALHLLAAPGRSLAADGAVSLSAEFEPLTDTVDRTTVSAADVEGADAGAPLSVGLLDASLEAIRSGDASSVSGVVLQYVQGVQQRSSPSTTFEFEFADESVTVTHYGGDSIAGGNLTVRVGGDPADAAFPQQVTAGDSVTVDLSGAEAGTSVKVVWTAAEDERAVVLDEATVPGGGTTVE